MPPSRSRGPASASGVASSSKDVFQQRGASVPAGAAAPSAKPVFTNAKAEMLYDLLLESQPLASTQTYTQADLLALPVANSVQELMPLCQELINLGLFQLLTLDGSVCYRLKTHSDASKVQSLDSDARIIYNTIEAAGTAGIWTKTLKARTNLHQTVLTRALKMLENRSYVKQVRNAKYPGRKIYMLQNLTPTDEVTGGPWYTDGELDQDLVHIVSDVILTYVESKSWRAGPKIKKHSASGASARQVHSTHHMISVHDRILLPHPPGYSGYPTAPEILTFIDSNNLVSGKDIELADLQTLLDILVFDRKLEVVAKKPPKASLRRISKPSTTFTSAQQKQHTETSSNKPRARIRRIDDEDDEDEDEDDDTTAAPPHQKRRKIFGLRGTPSPVPSDDEHDDPDADFEALPDQHHEEPMYRTVRHTGYPRPFSYNKQHDHPTAAPQPQPPPTAVAPDAANDTAASTTATATQPATLPPPTTAPAPAQTLPIATAEPPRTAFAETPCARCPVFRLCEDGGPVDARSCGYFSGWLAASAVDGLSIPGVAGGATGVLGGAAEVDFTNAGSARLAGGDGPGVVVEVDGERQAVAGAVGA